MKKRKFKSKAQNLLNLKIQNVKIPKSYVFTVKQFKEKEAQVIENIKKKFSKEIILRSSNKSEDTNKTSLAGRFISIPNLNPENHNQIKSSILKIIKSYKQFKSDNNEILVQNFIKNIKMSGVATSCDLKEYSPYITINYSLENNTAAITSGKQNYKTFVALRKTKIDKKYFIFSRIVNLIERLTVYYGNEFIELEFAINRDNHLYLFQVRPIIKKNNKSIDIDFTTKNLNRLKLKINKLKKRHHGLLGKDTAFGVMPDWNPAEIIGTKPKPLSLSLYQELITDHVWSQHRKSYGFRDLSSNHLMTTFFGMPYIDVRVDFNSWIPHKLNKNLANKLVEYYLAKFKRNPEFHDKTEFEILFTCLTPSTNNRLKKLKNFGFTKLDIDKIKKSLREININAFNQFKKNVKEIEILKIKQKHVLSSDMYNIDKIYWLIEDCKRYGTYPFAGLARCGFIAMDILNSFVSENIITKNDKEIFLQNVDTVASKIKHDSLKLSKNNFIKLYGHLRPNTYEITSKNYEEGYNEFFSKNKNFLNSKIIKFKLKATQIKKISQFLKVNKLDINYKELLLFIKKSISYREYSKFVFTKSIDGVFKNLKVLGNRNAIKPDDLSYLKIQSILDLYYNLTTNKIQTFLKEEIQKNKQEFNKSKFFKLPEIIYSHNDIYNFLENENKTNFIGRSVSTAKPYLIKNDKKLNLRDKIVCIESADPGYDFIFSQKIAGLITQFGGVNSHMAIRCAELSVPAAIGVGQNKFKNICESKIIRLDCESNKIDLIK